MKADIMPYLKSVTKCLVPFGSWSGAFPKSGNFDLNSISAVNHATLFVHRIGCGPGSFGLPGVVIIWLTGSVSFAWAYRTST
jgi:hypothetical protein